MSGRLNVFNLVLKAFLVEKNIFFKFEFIVSLYFKLQFIILIYIFT